MFFCVNICSNSVGENKTYQNARSNLPKHCDECLLKSIFQASGHWMYLSEMVALFHSLSAPFLLSFDFISSLMAIKGSFNLSFNLCLPLTSILTALISHLSLSTMLEIHDQPDWSSVCTAGGAGALMHLQINVRIIGSAGRYLDCRGGTSWRRTWALTHFNLNVQPFVQLILYFFQSGLNIESHWTEAGKLTCYFYAMGMLWIWIPEKTQTLDISST